MPESLSEILSASSAASSLRAEQSVVHLLRKQGWEAEQGSFYRDPDTGKLREIDTVARQIWTRELRSGAQVIRVHLHCEVKTAKGYHILFSGPISGRDLHYQFRVWLGSIADGNGRWLAKVLQREGVETREIVEAAEYFRAAAWPDECMLMSASAFDPPLITPLVTAFRETNVGNVKDLDASVLWRATSGLMSSFRSLRNHFIRYHASGISGAVGAAKVYGTPVGEYLFSAIDRHVRMIDHFHPVVVIEAPLWSIDGSNATSVPWVRFVQVDQIGTPISWCDVVTLEAAPDFFDLVSKHYKRHRHRLNAKSLILR